MALMTSPTTSESFSSNPTPTPPPSSATAPLSHSPITTTTTTTTITSAAATSLKGTTVLPPRQPSPSPPVLLHPSPLSPPFTTKFRLSSPTGIVTPPPFGTTEAEKIDLLSRSHTISAGSASGYGSPSAYSPVTVTASSFGVGGSSTATVTTNSLKSAGPSGRDVAAAQAHKRRRSRNHLLAISTYGKVATSLASPVTDAANTPGAPGSAPTPLSSSLSTLATAVREEDEVRLNDAGVDASGAGAAGAVGRGGAGGKGGGGAGGPGPTLTSAGRHRARPSLVGILGTDVHPDRPDDPKDLTLPLLSPMAARPEQSSIPDRDLSPGQSRSLSGIALRAFCLGLSLACSLCLTFYLLLWTSTPLWRIPFFTATLSLFHFLEFWVTASYNTRAATVDAFLLAQNWPAYQLANLAAVVECLVMTLVWPRFSSAFGAKAGAASWSYGYGIPALGNFLGSFLGPPSPSPYGTHGDPSTSSSFSYSPPSTTFLALSSATSTTSAVVRTLLLFIGLLLVVVGQTVRSAAMAQAGPSFNHTVQQRRSSQHVLVTTGIYATLRHPSYFGFYWWAIGTQMVLGNTACLLAYAAVLWRFFSDRIRHEEALLTRFFGREYVDYRNTVGTRIPFVS